MLNQSPNLVDYTPTRISSDPPFGSYNAGHMSPSVSASRGGEYFDYTSQIEGSTGPSRGNISRRKARAHASQHLPIGRSNRENQPNAGLPLLYNAPSAPGSRPQTPGSFPEGHHFQPQSTHLNVVHTQDTYHSSLDSSNQEHNYDQWSHTPSSHTRSRSTSTSDVRSVSPTGSVGSALTSLSSSHSTQNSQMSLPYSHALPSDEPRTKGRKMRLCNGDRKRMCQMHLDNPDWKQEQLAKLFDVERSTVSKILKNKETWLAVADVNSHRVAKHRPSKFPKIEKALVHKLWAASQGGTILSDSFIRSIAKKVAEEQSVAPERFKASSGWVDNFKSRAAIRRGVMTKGLEGLQIDEDSESEGVVRIMSQPSFGDPESEDSPEPTVPTSQHSYQLLPPTQAPSILLHVNQPPGRETLQDAEDAITTLRNFIANQPEDFVTDAERDALLHLSSRLVQASTGLPYQPNF